MLVLGLERDSENPFLEIEFWEMSVLLSEMKMAGAVYDLGFVQVRH